MTMQKVKILKRLGNIMALSMFLCFSACGAGRESTGNRDDTSNSGSALPLPEEYADYQKEVGDVMFREKEDVADTQNNTVIQDVDIRIYNYGPSILQEGENIRHAYYCSNKYTDPNNPSLDIDGDDFVTDYVAYRKGIKHNGEWYWSDKSYLTGPIIGSPTEGEHNCDPNVIKGKFRYDGASYSYLMAYLACSTRDNQYNHVSLAVANAPEGPWVKCGKINPFREYSDEGVPENMKKSSYLWGYGQASMISVDKKGRVLMFYSAIKPFYNASGEYWVHKTTTTVERWNLSDIENPEMEFQAESMPNVGIKRFDKQISSVTNGDYAYDPLKNRIYFVGDGEVIGGLGASGAPVAWVENKSKTGGTEIGDVFKEYGSDEWSDKGLQWNMVGYAHPADAYHYTTAHNSAVIRDEYGWLPYSGKIEVAITGGLNETTYPKVFPNAKDSNYIWSFRILRKTLKTEE